MTKEETRETISPPEVLPSAECDDVYELFIAELRQRRKRLEQLLRMVAIEANRHARLQASRARCKHPSSKLS